MDEIPWLMSKGCVANSRERLFYSKVHNESKHY